MPPETRRVAAIRKNIDYVARSTYCTQKGHGFQFRYFDTVKQASAYIRAGQRLCIDAIPTEPVLQVRVRRVKRRINFNQSIVYGKTPRRSFRLQIRPTGRAYEPERVFLEGDNNLWLWFARIDRRIEWRRQDMIMETLALALHPRAGRDSPVYQASLHPLFDMHVFSVLLNEALGRTPAQRNVRQ